MVKLAVRANGELNELARGSPRRAPKHDLPPLDHVRADILRIAITALIVLALLIPAYFLVG